MGSFTPFNGPIGVSGPSARDITEFLTAYNTLIAELKSHETKSAETDGSVHNIANYVKEQLQNYAQKNTVDNVITDMHDINSSITALQNAINSKVSNDTLNSYLPKTAASSNASTSNPLQTLNDLTAKLNNYAKTADVEDNIRTSISKFYDDANKILSAIELSVDNINAASINAELVNAQINAIKNIDFTKWHKISLQYAGTGTNIDTGTSGLYAIGYLSNIWNSDAPGGLNDSKAARIYIKYVNTLPFDAIIDCTVSHANKSWHGTIQAIVSKTPNTWEDLRFHLVHATTSNSVDRVYLCISAKELGTNIQHAITDVRVAGINFIPDSGVSNIVTGIVSTARMPLDKSSAVIASNVSITSVSADSITDVEGTEIYKVVHEIRNGKDEKHLVICDPQHGANAKNFRYIRLSERPRILVKRPDPTPEDPDHTKNVAEVFVTNKDVMNYAAYPIGTIVQWPLFREVTEVDSTTGETVHKAYVAKNVPNGWHACNADEINIKITDDTGMLITDPKYVDLEALVDGTTLKWKDEFLRDTIVLPLLDFQMMRTDAIDIYDALDTAAGEIDIDNLTQRMLAAETAINKHSEDINTINTIDNNQNNSIGTINNRLNDSTTGLDALSTRIDTEVTNRNTAIADAIDAEATRANAYTDSVGAATLNSAKTYTDDTVATEVTNRNTAIADAVSAEATRADAHADSVGTTTLNSAKTYTDDAVSTEATRADAHADSVGTTTLNSAKTYTDDAVSTEATRANAYTDSVGAATLNSAKTYTDDTVATEVTNRNTAIADAVSAEATRADAHADSVGTTILNSAKTYTDDTVATEASTRETTDDTILERINSFLRGTKVYASSADLPTETPDASGNIWTTGDTAVVFTGTVISIKTATVTGSTVTWS